MGAPGPGAPPPGPLRGGSTVARPPAGLPAKRGPQTVSGRVEEPPAAERGRGGGPLGPHLPGGPVRPYAVSGPDPSAIHDRPHDRPVRRREATRMSTPSGGHNPVEALAEEFLQRRRRGEHATL